jgi:hypothetical protein
VDAIDIQTYLMIRIMWWMTWSHGL